MAKLTVHQEKALEYKKHISLTANAGSGKTFVLSNRYLKIASESEISLRNIAAITFTDKAAGELYSKIAKLIDERLNESTNVKERRKLENIRSQLVSANISTIHSFCIDILREHPVEAELDANFTPIDEQTSTELIELSVEEMIKDSIKKDAYSGELKDLIRLFASKSLFAKEIISLIKERKNVITVAERIYSKSVEEIKTYFSNIFYEFAEKIYAKQIPLLAKSLMKINEAVLNLNKDNQKAIEVGELIEKLNKPQSFLSALPLLLKIQEQIILDKGNLSLRGYASKIKDEYSGDIEIIEAFFKDFKFINFPNNSEEIELELANAGKKLIFFFNHALEYYSKKKKENGYLDYEDILLYTKKILESEKVKDDISEKYKYIMIDEYQDTNEIQYNIFLPILDELRKGNLFVVGDEKQSIYMFRDAELEVFDKTKRNIKSASGIESLLTLPDSFRMAPAICLFTNILFKNLFSNPEILFNEVEHSDLVCARQDNVPGKIEILITSPDENNEEEAGNPEADTVAKRIIKLVYEENNRQNLSWKDIAILCRKRKYFTDLEKAFIKYGIPFIILGGKDFYRRQSIYDVFNYFSFLSNLKNDAALVGILRSPFFSLSDAVIYEISCQSGYSFWEKLCNYKSHYPALEIIVRTLKENSELAENSGAVFLLRKILTESPFLTVLGSKPDGVQEIANVEKLVKLTIHLFSKGFKTLYDYVVFLRDSIEQAGDESQAVVSEESNSAVIMTLHQAKGLEFPAVFLYKCGDLPNKSFVKSKSIIVNKNFGLLTKVPLKNNYSGTYESAPVIGISDLITRKKELAEIKRLLYVGITRAKDYLFISFSEQKENKYSSESFTGLIQKGLNIDFNSPSVTINAELDFLKSNVGNFDYQKTNLKVDISIIKEIELVNPPEKEVLISAVPHQIKISEINETQKGEIISATKLSVYKQCPLKYYLTYVVGYASLYKKYKVWKIKNNKFVRYEFNDSEDRKLAALQEDVSSEQKKEFSDVKGRVIHKILQLESLPEQFDSRAEEFINSELGFAEKNEMTLGKIKGEIVADLIGFYASLIYKQLKGYSSFKNEFEIYSKENDYYLYGIIDKLVIEGNKAIIIDYKTDDIDDAGIEEKIKTYSTQLEFYSILVSKLFTGIEKYELRLVFIKKPEKSYSKELELSDIQNIKKEIEKMAVSIREGDFTKNLKHCQRCSFSNNNYHCIVE